MGSNVLIVEDEALVALELRENIERLGHTVVDVTDSAERAVQLALTHKPDLVMMDIRLKGRMDGVEAAALIRKSADIPVVFLTAYSGEEILGRATETEPYGYLLKPVQEQQLASVIRVATHKHRQDTRVRESYRSASTILRALPNPVVVTGINLDVRYLNARAERLLGIAARQAIGKPIDEIVRITGKGQPHFDRESIPGFDEVLNDGVSVSLGDYTITPFAGDPIELSVEAGPLVDREGLILGALISFGAPGEARSQSVEIEIDKTLDTDPVIREKGDLRSYLEVEIVRLSMHDPGEDLQARRYREGQLSASKRILRFMFGQDALQDMEAILPAGGESGG